MPEFSMLTEKEKIEKFLDGLPLPKEHLSFYRNAIARMNDQQITDVAKLAEKAATLAAAAVSKLKRINEDEKVEEFSVKSKLNMRIARRKIRNGFVVLEVPSKLEVGESFQINSKRRRRYMHLLPSMMPNIVTTVDDSAEIIEIIKLQQKFDSQKKREFGDVGRILTVDFVVSTLNQRGTLASRRLVGRVLENSRSKNSRIEIINSVLTKKNKYYEDKSNTILGFLNTVKLNTVKPKRHRPVRFVVKSTDLQDADSVREKQQVGPGSAAKSIGRGA